MADLAQQQKSKFTSLIKNPFICVLSALLCCALWGSAFPFVKIGYSAFNIQAQAWQSQILFAGIRFFLAGIITVILGSIISKKILIPKKSSIKNILLLCVFQTIIQYIFFYIGLAHTTGTKGAVLNSTSIFFTVILSVFVFKQEKADIKKIIGCVIGFAGTVFINLARGSIFGGFTFMGDGFILICSLSYAFSCVLVKIYSKTENPVTLSGYQFAFGGFVMAVFGSLCGGRLDAINISGVLILLYLALLSAVAYTLWGVLLKYNSISKIAVIGFMTPVFGCLFSAVLLKENIADNALKTLCALVLVSAGIVIVNKSKN